MGNWMFPRNDADEDEGLANAGVEFFRDSPYSGIARECGQNSLDAAEYDLSTGKNHQVVLEFRRISVERNSIPAVEQIGGTIEACVRRANACENEKEIEFFSRARQLLSHHYVDVLQISDMGTKGLHGPSRQGTPFHALVKASGVSEKEDKSSGGSFGIGKNAAYAVSALRTVFYSTWYQSSGRAIFLCQGKAILASHVGEDGQPYRAAGYWGTDNFQPVDSIESLPEWLQRSHQGTTVSALGFVGGDDWHYQVAESLIRNFFAAVNRGLISFRVNDGLTIDAETIENLFDDPRVVSAGETQGSGEDLRFSKALHECLTSTEALVAEETFDDLGRMRLRLLVRDGLPKRIALLRNGMYITDSLQHFGDKLARFALQKDFVAILEPVDKDTGHVIRTLENPRHDELSPERIESPAEQRRVKAAFKKLIAWLRDVIRAETMTASENEVILDELNQFFASPERSQPMPDADGSEEDPTKILIRPLRSPSVRPPSSGADGEDGGGGGEKRSTASGGRTSGDGMGSGAGGIGGRGGRSVPVFDVRNQMGGVSGQKSRRVYLTPGASGKAEVKVYAPGISTREQLRIRSINGFEIGSRTPQVVIEEGTRCSIALEFFVDYEGPIEVALELAGEETT
jgi:hypothetical protein